MAVLLSCMTVFCDTGENPLWQVDFEHSTENPAAWGKLLDGAAVVHQYDKANTGEEFLVVKGRNDYHQYSLESPMIPAKPGENYILSFSYRFSPKVVRYGINVYVFGFDSKGKEVPIQIPGWAKDEVGTFYPVHGPGTGGWQVSQKELLIPEGVDSIRIKFRHGCLPVGQQIDIDSIKLVPAKPSVALSYRINSTDEKLAGKVSVLPASLGKNVRCYRVMLYDYDGKANFPPAWTKETQDKDRKKREHNTDFTVHPTGLPCHEVVLKGNESNFTIDLAKFESHGYIICAEAQLNDGRKLDTRNTIEDSVFYVMHDPEWKGNKLGILSDTDAPPPPWTPMEFDAGRRRVSTWNNRIDFSDDLSIRKIRFLNSRRDALGRDGAELKINGQSAGKLLSFGLPKLVKQTPNAVVLETQGSNENLRMDVTAQVEFDGYVLYKLRIKAIKSCSIDDIDYILPLSKGLARIVHPSDYHRRDVLDASNPQWQTDNFRPSVWIGDEQNGLVVCTNFESPSHSPSKLAGDVWTLTFIPETVKLKAGESLDIDFAVQPTPTRPRVKGYRDFMMRANPPKDTNIELLWSLPEYLPYLGFPIGRDEEAVKWAERVKSRPNSPKAIFYLSAAYHMTTLPAATWFADRWQLDRGSNAYSNEMPGYTYWSGDMIPVNFNDPLWQDYFCYYLDDFLNKGKFDGLYFDVSGGGLGRDGDILNNREFHKRIYTILKRHHPDGICIFHSIVNSAAPYVGFSDLLCRGEAYRIDLADHDYYLDFLTLDQFRAKTAVTAGQGVMFLPQYRQLHKRNDPKLASHAMGLVLLHDMNLWPSWMNQDAIQRVRDFQKEFRPLEGANFYPYWNDQRKVFLTCDKPEIAYSIYEKETNLFVVLLNTSDKSVKAKLTIAPMVFDSHVAMQVGRKAELLDPATGKIVSYDQKELMESGIDLNIGPRQCRILRYK